MKPKPQALEVWGELACFSDMKVERFSYPVITPSAARGIFDAIYCKPEKFRWQITRIEILSPPRYIALRRNEVSDKGPTQRTIEQWMRGSKSPKPIIADEVRQQRQTMALRDVHYVLVAEIRPWPGHEDQIQAFEAQFRRRAARGQCVYQPYFGCREFPAYFRLLEPGERLEPLRDYNADLGFMLYDVFDLSQPRDKYNRPLGEGAKAKKYLPWQPSIFHAVVKGGVLEVPDYSSPEVLKIEGVA